MEYTELEKLYKFTLENELSVTKHEVKLPSRDTASMLCNKYGVDANKRIQVLSDQRNVSFVFSVGKLTLFETVCTPSDEYKIEHEDIEE